MQAIITKAIMKLKQKIYKTDLVKKDCSIYNLSSLFLLDDFDL